MKGLHVKKDCLFCDVIEDQHHAIFDCKAYDTIRTEYQDMLREFPTVKDILNPKTKEMANDVGRFLKLIEAERKLLI